MKLYTFRKYIYYSNILLFGIIFVMAFESSQAWTEPSDSELNYSPIHAGFDGQSKLGGLTLNTDGAKVGLIIEKGFVGIGTTDPQGILDITSSTSGLLPPRMTTSERDLIKNPKSGMIIINTNTKKLNLNNGSSWGEIGGGEATYGTKTVFAGGSGKTGDYNCKKAVISSTGQQGAWQNINEGKNCGSGKWCKSGDCSLCGVDLYWDGSSLTCSSVGIGNYSPDNNNNRYPCTNKPANSTYTGSGGGINNCPWSCDTNYFQNGATCIPSVTITDLAWVNCNSRCSEIGKTCVSIGKNSEANDGTFNRNYGTIVCSVRHKTGGGCGTYCGNEGSLRYFCCGPKIQTRCRCQ